jgi:hypothetical protein
MEAYIMITRVIGILLVFYIGINRILHWIDGDYKNK